MKVSHYIKEVKKSQVFKEFMKEDPEAYLCSLFFIRDFNGPQNETQVDFYSPQKKEIVSFKVGKGVERVPLPKKAITITHKKFIPKPLDEDIKMDLDAIKPTLTDEMRNREMTYEIEKLLVVINTVDGKVVWNCTGFLKGLGLLQAHIEDRSQSVLFMEKRSLMDMIRFPNQVGMLGMGEPPGIGQPVGPSYGGGMVSATPDIQVLSQADLEAELQKEKEEAKQAEKAARQAKKNLLENKQRKNSQSAAELKKKGVKSK